jgi:maltose-binding protein MalE
MPSRKGAKVKHAAFGNTTVMGIYSKSKNQLAAYKLIEAVAAPDVMKKMAIEDALPPTRKSVIQDPEVAAKKPIMSNLDKITAPDVYLFTDPMIPEFGEFMDIAATSLAEVYGGQETVENSFNAAQEKLIELFKKAGYIK